MKRSDSYQSARQPRVKPLRGRAPLAAVTLVAVLIAGLASVGLGVTPAVAATKVAKAAGASANLACVGSGNGKGKKLVIGSLQTDASSSAAFPEITEGVKACFDAINATGGIKGRPIDFRRCNDNADAVVGEKCARDLIDAKAIAVIGGICFSCFSAPIVDVLDKGGVPYVGGLPVLPNDYKQTNFLPITNAGGSASLFTNAAYILGTAKKKKVPASVVEVNASVGAIDPTLENQIKKLGGNYLGRVNFDPTSADLASIAQQAIDKKPNFVSVQTDGPNTVKLVTNLRSQGYKGDIVILGTASAPQSIDAMGAAGNGVYVASFFPDLGGGSSADAKKFQADMKQDGFDPRKSLSAVGYAGAYATAAALSQVKGPVTVASFKKSLLALDGLQPVFGGQLSYKNATPEYPRSFYFAAYGNVILDGRTILTGDAFNWLTGEPLNG